MTTHDIARRAPDNSALIARNLSLRQAQLVVLQVSGDLLAGKGLLSSWTDAALYEVELVRVQAVDRPEIGAGLTYGERAVEDVAGEKFGAEPWEWRQKWDIVPATLADVKSDLIDRARRLLEKYTEKLSTPETELMAEIGRAELEQARVAAAGGTFDTSRYPIIATIAAAQDPPVTFGQAATYINDNLRDPWKAKLGKYMAKYLDVVFRIQAISPGSGAAQQCKDIYDELAGFTP